MIALKSITAMQNYKKMKSIAVIIKCYYIYKFLDIFTSLFIVELDVLPLKYLHVKSQNDTVSSINKRMTLWVNKGSSSIS